MERTMTVEEKIRRAEEIYNRKMENKGRTQTARVGVERTNRSTFGKLKSLMIICVLLYAITYFIINGNFTFSEQVKNKVDEILGYDISINKIFSSIGNLWSGLNAKLNDIDNNEKKQEEKKQEENSQDKGEENQNEKIENEGNDNNSNTENKDITENENQLQEVIENGENIGKEENIQASIGGGTDEDQLEENLAEETQMINDANEIKKNINFIKPIQGTVTSAFGVRESTSSIVSKNHTGLDIAAVQGTEIKSATNGKVVLVSNEGSYGNHVKIEIDDVSIIYAHCLKINVKEGDEIKQGQKIAEVGSTGNSTGPHLHFEVRKGGRYVNPELILEF